MTGWQFAKPARRAWRSTGILPGSSGFPVSDSSTHFSTVSMAKRFADRRPAMGAKCLEEQVGIREDLDSCHRGSKLERHRQSVLGKKPAEGLEIPIQGFGGLARRETTLLDCLVEHLDEIR